MYRMAVLITPDVERPLLREADEEHAKGTFFELSEMPIARDVFGLPRGGALATVHAHVSVATLW